MSDDNSQESPVDIKEHLTTDYRAELRHTIWYRQYLAKEMRKTDQEIIELQNKIARSNK